MIADILQQYRHSKAKAGDAILLFRCGDFYEILGDDARLCCKLLGLTPTIHHQRSGDERVMAGIPCHSLDRYRNKLAAAGYRVAVSEYVPTESEAT